MVLGAITNLYAANQANYRASRDRQLQRDQFNQNMKAQYDFAQHGLSWRIQDAESAGVNKLLGAGINPASFSPQAMTNVQNDSPEYISRAGQDISNAIQRMKSPTQKRAEELQLRGLQEKVKNQELENNLLEQKIQNNSVDTSLSYDSDFGVINGQVDTVNGGSVSAFNPLTGDQARADHYFTSNEVPLSSKKGVQSGVIPMERGVLRKDNYYLFLPSEKGKESIEDLAIEELRYSGNKALDQGKTIYYYWQSHSKGAKKNREYLAKIRPKSNKPGYEFRMNPYNGLFKLVKKRGQSKFYLFDKKGVKGRRLNFDQSGRKRIVY